MEVRIVSRRKWNCSISLLAVGRITNSASQGLDHLDAPAHSFHDQVDNTLCSQEYDECLDRIRDTNTILPSLCTISPELLTVGPDLFIQGGPPGGAEVSFFYASTAVFVIVNDPADVAPRSRHKEPFETSKHPTPLWYRYLST